MPKPAIVRPWTKALLLPLGLFGGIGLAAAAEPNSRTAPATTCPTPTAAQCTAAGYLDSACGQKHLATCKPHVLKALEDHPSRASAATRKMLRPNRDDIPKDLRSGRVISQYKAPPQRSGQPAGRNLLARTGLTRPVQDKVDPATAAKSHRNPAWDKNGQLITSCQEYAYEKVYDWARFTDAAATCAGDYDCILSVAYMPSTPGIAYRVLKSKDGTALNPQPPGNYRAGTTRAKNDMFSYMNYIYVGGPGGVAKTPELEAAHKALEEGKTWYSFGCKGSCNARQFKNDFDFHEKLRARNSTLTRAEFEEYERRKAEFRALVWQHQAAVAREAFSRHPGKNITTPVKLPFDEVTPDPAQWINTMRKAAQRLEGSRPRPGTRTRPVGRSPVQPSGASPSREVPPARRGALERMQRDEGALPRSIVPPTDVLAITAPTTQGPAGPITEVKGPCAPHLWTGTKIEEAKGIGPISCRIGEFLRKEWSRKAAGQKSCLDLADDDCDWSPSMFEGTFVTAAPYLSQQAQYENACMQWTNGKLPAGENENLAKADAYIKAQREYIQKQFAKLGGYLEGQGDKGKKLGDTRGDKGQVGDTSKIAGGYAFSWGWGVEPTALTAAGGDICGLHGWTKAEADAYVYLASHRFDLVDGLLEFAVNDPKDPGHSTRLSAHLDIIGKEIIKPKIEKSYNVVIDRSLFDEKFSYPAKGSRPSMQVWILTVSAWAELVFSGDLKVEGKAGSSCNAEDVLFNLRTTFTPSVAVDARAQAGVGVSGIASAGVRGRLNVVTLGVPLTMSVRAAKGNYNGAEHVGLLVDGDAALLLGTLSGGLSLYVETLFSEDEFEIFKWKGVGPKEIPLAHPVDVNIPLYALK